MREFIACLLDLGVSPDSIKTLVQRNPRKLLGARALIKTGFTKP
jgi:hypothetical protein